MQMHKNVTKCGYSR